MMKHEKAMLLEYRMLPETISLAAAVYQYRFVTFYTQPNAPNILPIFVNDETSVYSFSLVATMKNADKKNRSGHRSNRRKLAH